MIQYKKESSYLCRAAQVQRWGTYGLQTEGLAIWRGVHGPHAFKVRIHTLNLFFTLQRVYYIKLQKMAI